MDFDASFYYFFQHGLETPLLKQQCPSLIFFSATRTLVKLDIELRMDARHGNSYMDATPKAHKSNAGAISE